MSSIDKDPIFASQRTIDQLAMSSLSFMGFGPESSGSAQFEVPDEFVDEMGFIELVVTAHGDVDGMPGTFCILSRPIDDPAFYSDMKVYAFADGYAQEASVRLEMDDDDMDVLEMCDRRTEQWAMAVAQLECLGISTVEREAERLQSVVAEYTQYQVMLSDLRRMQTQVTSPDEYYQIGDRIVEVQDSMALLRVPQCSMHAAQTGEEYERLLATTVLERFRRADVIAKSMSNSSDAIGRVQDQIAEKPMQTWRATEASLWELQRAFDRIATF